MNWFHNKGKFEDSTDEEKDEVDVAFALLKTLFREKDVNADDIITKSDFISILSSLKGNQLSESSLQSIFQQMNLNSTQVSFKKFLYGIYLFVVQ